MEKIALNYKDICLIPNKCKVKSRSECSTEITFLGKKFKSPVVPSNMVSVLNEDIAKQLSFGGQFYIFHRFSDTRKFVQRARSESWPIISISVGVKDEDKELIKDISESKCRVDFVTIDIANGYSDTVADMIKFIKENLDTKVIAGNIWGDKASVEFLQDVGADGIKIGLSCGKGCFLGSTRITTDNGLKCIKDISIGDMVKTHTGEFKPVIDTMIEQSSDLIEINGQICTTDHKFYVIDVTDNVIDDNYIEKHAYWLEANKINTNLHFIITFVR